VTGRRPRFLRERSRREEFLPCGESGGESRPTEEGGNARAEKRSVLIVKSARALAETLSQGAMLRSSCANTAV
jgi:hypothetical protein